jgi:hypothetical protein
MISPAFTCELEYVTRPRLSPWRRDRRLRVLRWILRGSITPIIYTAQSISLLGGENVSEGQKSSIPLLSGHKHIPLAQHLCTEPHIGRGRHSVDYASAPRVSHQQSR